VAWPTSELTENVSLQVLAFRLTDFWATLHLEGFEKIMQILSEDRAATVTPLPFSALHKNLTYNSSITVLYYTQSYNNKTTNIFNFCYHAEHKEPLLSGGQ
jgi:hypothetical protein